MPILNDRRFQYLVIVLTILAFYTRTLSYGFIWDDFSYVINNPVLGPNTNILDLWTKKVSVDFWPFSYSFFWGLKYFFGSNPIAYHASNIILFTISAVFLLSLLVKLKVEHALLFVLVFCVHPMNVSLVTWIFQAKTNLANIFGILSFLYFINYIDKDRLYHYFLSIIFLILSFLSKITLVMLPVIFLCFFIFKNKPLKSAWKLAPFFLLSLILGVTNLLWDQNAFPVPPSELILDSDILFRLILLGQNLWFYISKIFYPVDLMFVHPKLEPDLQSMTDYIPIILLFLCLASGLFWYIRSRKMTPIMLCFFTSFLIIFPALGLFEIYYMRFSYVAEHYLNLALIGFIIPVVYYLLRTIPGKCVVVVYIIFLGYQNFTYVPTYASERKLFEDSAQKNSNNILPHNILGLVYKNEGNYQKAFYHYNRSIEIHPNAASFYNKAKLLDNLGQVGTAKQDYEKAISLNPYFSGSYINLGILYLKMKNNSKSLEYFNAALKINPSNPAIYYNIGFYYESNKNLELAKAWYEKALALDPTNELFQHAIRDVTNIK